MTDATEKRMTLGEHLEELRRRLLYVLGGAAVAFVLCFLLFRNELLDAVVRPVYPQWRLFGRDILVLEPVDVKFTMGAPYTAFTTYLFISLVAGCIASAPWALYHLWAFIAAGLYPRERRWVYVFGPLSVLLFATGALFFYFVVYPVVVSFLYSYAEDFNRYVVATGGEPMITRDTLFGGYIHFVMLLTFVFGLMFELPLVVYFLGRVGLVRVETFRRYRRHVIVALVAVAAMVTPPDVFSQVALAVPMWVLYEAGVLAVRLTQRRTPRSGT